jgi:hypothetical protein
MCDAQSCRLLPTVRREGGLADKILLAFHQACDQQDNEVAFELLIVLDFMAMRQPPLSEMAKFVASLVAAHERMWEMQHPLESGGGAGVRVRKG